MEDIIAFETKHGITLKIIDQKEKEKAKVLPLEDYDRFVRSLRVFYENAEQVRIQKSGNPSLPYTYVDFGFKRPGKTWKTFLEILQNQDHSYNVGPARYGIKQRNKQYDSTLGLLKELNKKWITFIDKTFSLEAPTGFRIYEKGKGDKPGTYYFKFQIEDGLSNKKTKLTDGELNLKIADLRRKKKERGYLNQTEMTNIEDLLTEVRQRKLRSDGEIETIIKEVTESFRGEEKIEYDFYESKKGIN